VLALNDNAYGAAVVIVLGALAFAAYVMRR
jgi:hypothetical protein